MTQNQSILNLHPLVRLLRLLFWLTVWFFLFFAVIAFSLRTQTVQTFIVRFLAEKASEKLGFDCQISAFYLDWVDFAHIKGVRVLDKQKKVMLDIPSIRVNLKLSSLLEKNIRLDLVEIRKGTINLCKNKTDGELNIDEFVTAIQDWVDGGDTTRSLNPGTFSIDKTLLRDVTFSYFDERENRLPNQFDYFHFKLRGVSGLVENFWQRRDTIRLDAQGLRGSDAATGLDIHTLSTHFRFTKQDMLFGKLKAEIGESFLRDSLAFQYKSTADFSDFNHLVDVHARLDSSVIQTQDLSLFAPALKDWFETYTVSGKIEGTVDNIRGTRLNVFTGRNTFLTGSINLRGLPEVDETFADIRLKPSFVNPADLAFYTGPEAADYLAKFGVFDVSGSFTGFFKNFVTRSTFKTRLGTLYADMQMKIADQLQASTYNGRLKTSSFQLGELLKQTRYVQNIDFDGTFEGKGFLPSTADVALKADIARFGVLGYEYANIHTEGRFTKERFTGNLQIKDRHLIFNGKGNIDLRKGREIVDFEAVLGRANLKPLKLMAEPLDISAEVAMHFTGFDFDNFLGSSQLRNVRVLLRDERLDLNEVSIESHIDKGKKTFSFRSPLVDAVLEGSFKYRKLVEDVLAMVDEYGRLIRNKAAINQEDFARKRRLEAKEYGISAKLNIKDLNPLLDLLDVPVKLSPNTEIDGQLRFGQTEMVLLKTSIDSVYINNAVLYNTSIDVSAIKTIERPDVVAEAYVYSGKQNWGGGFKTEKVLFDGVWDHGKIGFKLLGQEQESTNRADIFGQVAFEPQTTRIRLQKSSLSLVERIWNINEENEIEVSDSSTVNLKNVAMRNENQELSVEGFLTGDPMDSLFVRARNFELETLKPLTREDFRGKVDAAIIITHLSSQPLVEGLLKVDSLAYQKYDIGNFSGKAQWSAEQKHLELSGSLSREGQDVLSLTGFYAPDLPDPLQVKLQVQRLPLQVLYMVLGNSVSQLNGNASGDLFVRGSFSQPQFTGRLFVRDGQLKINYLNTLYTFSHWVNFLPDEINADGAQLTDENGQTGILNRAALRHNYFRNFSVDLNGNLSNFMVFNIPAKAGELYYGTTICTGNLRISGGFDDITIRARARTNKGTKIFIPLDATVKEDLGESFITFTSKTFSGAQPKDSIGKVRLSGIKMDFDLDVTEDAYGEIIFDKKAGDIIRATGSGKVKMIIDTRGEFSVIGQYVIKKGDYHFTTYNLVNKDFDIKPGSTITWNGPVLEGVMDILAEYNLNASLAPLATGDDQLQQRPEARRRYPVLVTMRLTDQLLKPNIGLNLDIKDYPRNSDLNYYVQAFLARVATDEQELNRQVFSLMIFRMFAPMGEFTRTSGISYSSFSDLVSNQLSSWLSQFNENLEVSVDLSGLSQADLNNFQLRFSYTLLDGRLRLTRDGSFTNAQNQASALSIAGDWTLEYMLSKNGIFRVKMFHRINQNLILSGLNTNNTTQGASLLHTTSFNKLSELFPKKKKKTKPKAKDVPPPLVGPPLSREGLAGPGEEEQKVH